MPFIQFETQNTNFTGFIEKRTLPRIAKYKNIYHVLSTETRRTTPDSQRTLNFSTSI